MYCGSMKICLNLLSILIIIFGYYPSNNSLYLVQTAKTDAPGPNSSSTGPRTVAVRSTSPTRKPNETFHQISSTTTILTKKTTAVTIKDWSNPTDLINQLDKLLKQILADTNLSKQRLFQYLTTIDTTLHYVIDREAEINFNYAQTITSKTLEIFDKLISANNVWNSMDTIDRIDASTVIFRCTNTISSLLDLRLSESSISYPLRYDLPTIQTIALRTRSGDDAQFGHIGTFESIRASFSGLSKYSDNRAFGVSVVVFQNLSLHLSYDDALIDSHIVSLVVRGNSGDTFLDKIRYASFGLPKMPIFNEIPNCVWWNLPEKAWSADECRYVADQSLPFKPVCECSNRKSVNFTGGGTFGVMFGDPGGEPVDEENNAEILDELEGILANITVPENVTVEDWFASLKQSADIIANITQDDMIDRVNRSTAVHVTNITLALFNSLIEKPQVWNNLTQYERVNSSSRIFQSIQSLSILMNSKQDEDETYFEQDSILFATKLFTIDEESGGDCDDDEDTESGDDEGSAKITFDFDDINISLPFSALNLNSSTCFNETATNDAETSVPIFSKTTIRKSKPQKIATSASILRNITTYLSFSDETIPNSQVISITVDRDRTSIELIEPFRLKFVSKNIVPLQFGDQAKCAFWSFRRNHWSSKGCAVNRRETNRTATVCECDHLTDFSALADISGREWPNSAKSALTYVCSGVTCIFLLISLYIALRHNKRAYVLHDDQFKVKSNRYSLNIRISCWLFLAHLLVMFGMDRTEWRPLCGVMSIALLFTLLTAFSFMLMLAVHLYLSTSRRYLFRFVSFRTFAIFAYSFPIAIIALSIVIIYLYEARDVGELFDSLTGEYFCWISSSRYPAHIWIFLVPVTMIITINMLILLSIFVTIARNNSPPPSSTTGPQKNTKIANSEKHYVNMFTVYILLFNFGIPWILFIFYINEQMAFVFSYIFILINGTQGLALFAEQYYLYWMNKRKSNKRQQPDGAPSSKSYSSIMSHSSGNGNTITTNISSSSYTFDKSPIPSAPPFSASMLKRQID